MKYIRNILLLTGVLMFLVGCVTVPIKPGTPQEVKLTIQSEKEVKIEDKIHRSMEIVNPDLEFSFNCRINGDTAYMIIDISAWDAKGFWKDSKLIQKMGIKDLIIYLNSYGGNAAQGMSITDELEIVKSSGIKITIEARGVVYSAAIPVLVMGDYRICSKRTTFLIHPASLMKWGFFTETLQDLISQAEMIKIQRDHYASVVSSRTKLSKEKVFEMMDKDTWFTAKQAKDWGLVDSIAGE